MSRKQPLPTASISPYAVGAVFLGVSLVGILHHEMWRDEHQAWMVARHAHSLGELLQNLRYEGNPCLWHLLLFALTTFTHHETAMQVLHVLVATGYVFVLWRCAPLPTLWKALFTFGYYPFFEYNLISRSYGLGLLLVFVFCALYPHRRTHLIPVSIVLFLLSNTHVFGLMLSLCFAGILVLEYVTSRDGWDRRRRVLTLSVVIVVTGWVAAAAQIVPEPDNSFVVNYPDGTFERERVEHALGRIVVAYAALPRLYDFAFWNTSVFEAPYATGQVSATIHPVWPGLLFFTFAAGFLRKRRILLLYSFGTAGLCYFFYYSLLTSARYSGHLFVLLVSAMWLAACHDESPLPTALLDRVSKVARDGSRLAFTLLLAISAVGGLGSYLRDLQLPFTGSAEAAAFISAQSEAKGEIVAVTDFLMSPLAALLDRELYYPQRKTHGSFIIWDGRRRNDITLAAVKDEIQERYDATKRPLLFVTEKALSFGASVTQRGPFTDRLEAELLYPGISGIVEDERYYIYRIDEKH